MKDLDELVVLKLLAKNSEQNDDDYDSDDDDHDEGDDNDKYAPYRLFTSKEAKNIPTLRNTIEARINSIIEKKLVESFLTNVRTKGKLQESQFNQVDPELNQYIFSLETELEKSIALLSLNDMYAGMLNTVYREFREDCLFRLRSNFIEGKRWSSTFNTADGIPNDSNKSGQNEEEESEEKEECEEGEEGPDEQPAEDEESQEVTEKVVKGEKDWFEGYIDKGSYEFYVGSGFDQGVYPNDNSDKIKKKEQLFKSLADFYVYNRRQADVARHNLYRASNRFLEHWIVGYILDPPQSESLQDYFVYHFIDLATNPLNEVRIFDIILTLYSIDSEDQASLKEFNTYFNTKLTVDEFKSTLATFSENLMKVLGKYLNSSVDKRNALELENFDEVVAATEKIVGVLPFKNKVKIFTSVKTPKNAWVEICRKILESGITEKSIIEKAGGIVCKFEAKNLTPYDRSPQQTVASIQNTIDSIIGLPQHSRVKKDLHKKILFCLENNEVFFHFLDFIQREYSLKIESANAVLNEWVLQLKQVSKGELDKSEVKYILENINKDREIQKNQLFIQLIAKQSENIIGGFRQSGDKFSSEQRTFCASVKAMLAGLLDNKGFKNMYLYSIQIFELIEEIKKSSDEEIEELSHLESLLDLIIDIYRVYRAHGALQEINERMAFMTFMVGLLGKQLEGIQIQTESGSQAEEGKANSGSKFGRFSAIDEDSKSNQEKSSFPGLDRSMTSIRESGVVKYDEMLMRLSQKARTLLQEIKLSNLPSVYSALEIAVKREEERFIQFPWLLSIDKKFEFFKAYWQREERQLAEFELSKI